VLGSLFKKWAQSVKNNVIMQSEIILFID